MKNLKFKVTFKEQPEPDYSVPVGQMRPGQIGVMTHYRGDAGHRYVGSIVGWSHPGPCEVPTLHDIDGRSYGAYVEHTLGGPDLGTRVQILADGDQLAVGKDGALTVKWAERPAKDPTIPVRDLEPGQAGVVTGWSYGHEAYNGMVVARSPHWAKEDRINVLGDDNGWNPVPQGGDCRVRPLGPGDILEAYEEEHDWRDKKEADHQEVFLTPERIAGLTGRALRKPSRC